MQITESELREAIKDIEEGNDTRMIRGVCVLIELAQLHLKVMQSGMPEKIKKHNIIEYKDGYNQCHFDLTAWLAQKLEGLEKVIYNAIRYTCAEPVCKKTCPGYERDCGVKKMSRLVFEAIRAELGV